MQSEDIIKSGLTEGSVPASTSENGEMPNFSFKGGDELNELPPLPYNPVRDKDSDWQPMIDVSDDGDDDADPFAHGSGFAYDADDDYEVTDHGITEKNEETAPAAQDGPEEARTEINEKEDPAEQHAVHGESTDRIGESETRHDGSGEQTAPGFCGAQTDGLLEDSSNAGNGGSADEEHGAGGSGAGENVDAAAESAGEKNCGEEGRTESVESAEEANAAPEPIETRIEFEPVKEEAEPEIEYDRRDDLISQLAAVTGALKDRGDKSDTVVSVPGAFRRSAAERSENTTGSVPNYADDDEETAFGDDSEPEVIDGSGIGWRRKQLRQQAEKTGNKLIVDDEDITAVAAEYIDRRSVKKAAGTDEDADDDLSDAELAALFAEAERKKTRVLPAGIAAGEGGVVVSADYLGRLIERNSDLGGSEAMPNAAETSGGGGIDDSEKTALLDTGPENGNGDADEDEVQDGFDPDAPGNEDSQNGEDITGADGKTVARRKLFRPRGGEEVLDYEDVFQDDPGVTRKKALKRKALSVLKEVLKNLLIFILVFALVIFGYLTYAVYVSRTNVVYGDSMLPTLHEGDKVKTTLMPYVSGKPQVGDIVVIDMTALDRLLKYGDRFGYFDRVSDVLRNNKNISKMFFKGREPDTLWIKRVVGVAGDKLEFRDNKFFRNGELVVEDYLNDQTITNYPNGTIIEVKPGYVFVMGDNRNVSNDSRNPDNGDNGQIPIAVITGKLKKN